MHFVYLHGFLSGGQSIKGQALGRYIRAYCPDDAFYAPDYPDVPAHALKYLQGFFTDLQHRHPGEPIGLAASSMGGFYAGLMAERCDFPAVLFNPCVHPTDYFAALAQGPQENPYTGEKFTLNDGMLADLQRAQDEIDRTLSPHRYAVFVQTDDEVLDYRRAVKFYQGSQVTITPGGCHAYENFSADIPAALEFLRSFYKKQA